MKTLLPLLALGALAVACAPVPGPGGPVGGPPPTFSNQDFAWSAVPGDNAVAGRVAYSRDGRSWACAGAVGLTPDTPYTRRRIGTLYGSTQQAAIPAAVVRARSIQEAGDDYRSYVRDTQCDADGRFRFDYLPAGSWYLIAPVRADGEEPVVLMKRVTTARGRATAVTLD